VNGVRNRWKVGGRLQWLHVAVSAHVTVYAILAGTRIRAVGSDSGADYDGFLVHDGWAPTNRFPLASIKVVWPPAKRCREMAQIPAGGGKISPGVGSAADELELRDRYERGEISSTACRCHGEVEAKLEQMLEKPVDIHQPATGTPSGCMNGLGCSPSCTPRPGWHQQRRNGDPRHGDRAQGLGWERTGKEHHAADLVSVLRTCWQRARTLRAHTVVARAPQRVILDIVPGAD